MQAVILAGGQGSRLSPFTNALPKPLLPIGGKALIEQQILQFQKFGFSAVYVCTHHMSDYIENFIGNGARYGIPIFYSNEPQPLGTAGPLKLLETELTKPFLVINGDILTNLDLSQFYDASIEARYDACISYKIIVTKSEFGLLEFKEDKIIGIKEKALQSQKIMSGIYFFQPTILNYIPKDRCFGMDELVTELADSNLDIGSMEILDYWMDIGQATDYKAAVDGWKKNFL
jgi:NDP-sugar pyrophosphorylase family protein